MFVIGTAGHVDHGKTRLIEALTGIDADRLPEEKERGMTIDLGFAHFEGETGRPIGVIDVPGHERFIRNMVAGAWSLSCALLVVAADEGWMRQSEDHARVLALMAIKPVVLVITKADLVSEEDAELIREDGLDQCERIFGYRPESVVVSALTKDGISRLKQLISLTLADVPEPKKTGPVCYYIDRVFTIRGAGTVVTGSLTGGSLAEGQEVLVLPQSRKVQIRSIQSYYADAKEAGPVSRVALNLQSVRKTELHRGMCITDDPGAFWTEKEYVVTLEEKLAAFDGKPKREVEISYGTDHRIASLFLLKSGKAARVVFEEPAAVRWSQRCLLIRHGGSSVLAGGRFLWPGKTSRIERHKIEMIMDRLTVSALTDFRQLKLLRYGWIKIDSFTPFADIPGIQIVRAEDYILLSETEKQLKERIVHEISVPGGAVLSEVSTKLALPSPLVEALLSDLLSAGLVKLENNVYFCGPSGGKENAITKTGKKILEQMIAKGKEGTDLKSLSIPGAQKELRYLVRIGEAVPLEGSIYYTKDTYAGLVEKILSGFSVGDRFSIPEAKERTALSRKFMIPLLNRMEQDGYVRREENERVVLKAG